MIPNSSFSQPFRFRDPRQERIYRRLSLVGPGCAAFYLDACRFMDLEPPLSTTTHMVGHAFREIESALRDVLQPLMTPPETSSSGKNNHADEIRAILSGLEIDEDEPIAQAWLQLSRRTNAYALSALAHRNALASPRPVDQEFQQFFGSFEGILDHILERFESRYLATFEQLDELLGISSPTEADLKRLRNHVSNSTVSLGYFFARLSSVTWLAPLWEIGFFTALPETYYEAETGTGRFPPWPVSAYLVRMAPVEPESVTEIVLQVPDTDNIRVNETLVDVALALPTNLGARLVPKLIRSLATPYAFPAPDKLSSLIVKLVGDGEVEAALNLARVLFTPLPPSQSSIQSSESGGTILPSKLRTHFWDSSLYKRHLESVLPFLLQADGNNTLVFLCDLLDRAIVLLLEEEKRPSDGSHLWRPNIEEETDFYMHKLENIIVSAALSISEQLARNNPAAVPNIVRTNESFQWFIFHRIALRLLNLFPESAPNLVTAKIMDFETSDQPELRFEHSRLLQERFTHLSTEEQTKILEWIAAGPNLVKFAEARAQWRGEPPSLEEITNYVYRWRRDRLALLRASPSFPGVWEQEYQRLVSIVGPASELKSSSGPTPMSWTRESSSLLIDELRAMAIEDIVAHLRDWQPSSVPTTDSQEGLAQTLTLVVSSDPRTFAAKAKEFMELSPIYVSALLQGFQNALESNLAFEWAPVLKLSQWVIEHAKVNGRQDNGGETGQDWSWTRQIIAGLLSKGLEHGRDGEIPFHFRTSVWKVLKPLTNDPHPTPAYEARYGGENMNPAGLSINTVRGKAMHAVMGYGLWVRRHHREAEEGEQTASFNEMPEVQDVLEAHLGRDPSPTIRSVYGWWFPWIVSIDSDWATQNFARIFPRDIPELRKAAWNAYLAFNWPRGDILEVLREEYSLAVDDAGAAQDESMGWLTESKARLGQHLMILYWRGELELDDPNNLINRFFVNAPASARGKAFEFIGLSLNRNEDEVPEVILGRLRVLWEQRFNDIVKAGMLEPSEPELVAFGWWFISGKFGDDWAIIQLRRILELGVQLEPEHTIVERLANLAPTWPALAVECLNLVFDNDVDGWGIYRWRDSARAIVAHALQSSDDVAVRNATGLVNRLAARGILDFRDLLPS